MCDPVGRGMTDDNFSIYSQWTCAPFVEYAQIRLICGPIINFVWLLIHPTFMVDGTLLLSSQKCDLDSFPNAGYILFIE